MVCPNCRLTNPDTALQCDCGYIFKTGIITRHTTNKPGPTEEREPDVLFGERGAGAIIARRIFAWVNLASGMALGVCFLSLMVETTNETLRPFYLALSVGLLAQGIIGWALLLVIAVVAENVIWIRKLLPIGGK